MSRAYDAILLLGYGLDENDQATQELCLRVQAAAKAYSEGYAKVIVACGGTTPGHWISEAEVMTKLLQEEGVPRDAIVLENQSQITIENMRFAAKKLGGAKGKRVLVVTSDYHVRRAVLTAMRAGFKAKGYAATLEHDEAWQEKKSKELAYTVDMFLGWQDEGKRRPQWIYKLFDFVFGKKCVKALDPDAASCCMLGTYPAGTGRRRNRTKGQARHFYGADRGNDWHR